LVFIFHSSRFIDLSFATRIVDSLQAEGDFSAPASTSRSGLGGRPPRRSTFASHHVKRTLRKARLDAKHSVYDSLRQTRLRQSGAHLIFCDDNECEWSPGDFGDEGRAFRTRQTRGSGSVVDRACMAVACQDSSCGGRHIAACNKRNPVFG
jgi:hypothetical protein